MRRGSLKHKNTIYKKEEMINKQATMFKFSSKQRNINSNIIFNHHPVLSRSVMSNFCDPMDYSPPGSSVHGGSPSKNTGLGCHALLQGIFPTQKSNPCLLHLLHYRHIPYHRTPGEAHLYQYIDINIVISIDT